MKLQVAIDRVPMERAMEIVKNITSEANIIEIGISYQGIRYACSTARY